MIVRIVLVLVSTAALAGCGGGSGGRHTVVAAFYPLAYAAERIGGPSFDVHNLTPPGAEPHDLELTPREVARIQQAAVVLYLSHGFQPAVSKAVADARGIPVAVLAGRYGLKQVAITGIAPEAEPTPQQLAHVIEVVRRTRATTVFFETLVSPR